MPSEVRLIVAAKEARLVLAKDGDVIEDELWRFDRQVGGSEAKQMCRVLFDMAFDFMNQTVHGDS